MAQTLKYAFPDKFLWGTATAAYQVEGNNTNADWWQWERVPGAILEGHTSGQASDWWEDAEADLQRAADLNNNAHRLSLAWDRIEPEPDGFDQAAIDRYRGILTKMHDLGLEPMVTLYHFVNPIWLAETGDLLADDIVNRFQKYTAKVVAELGDLVAKWVTVNEPMVYIVLRYIEDAFPEPKDGRGWANGMKALSNLLRCHAAAYHTIKQVYPQSPVGVAKQYRPILAPVGGRAAEVWAGQLSTLFNDFWMRAMTDGRLRLPVGTSKISYLAETYDFVGVNYYTYSNVAWPPSPALYDDAYPDDAIVGDGNYGEIYPQGMMMALVWASQFGKPIYVTENGMPDADDDHRPWFLLTHLREVHRAIERGIDVRGYYHWSLVDNFEWERGWTQRFGLYALDLESQQRTLTESGKLYKKICKAGGFAGGDLAKVMPAGY